MIANVPTIDNGTARLGMIVADRLRRNRKITMTTSAMVSMSVNCTSCTDSRIATDRSYTTLRFTAAGRRAPDTGRRVPYWRAVAVGDDDRAIGGGIHELTGGLHVVGLVRSPQRAGRLVHVGARDGRLHLVDPDA